MSDNSPWMSIKPSKEKKGETKENFSVVQKGKKRVQAVSRMGK